MTAIPCPTYNQSSNERSLLVRGSLLKVLFLINKKLRSDLRLQDNSQNKTGKKIFFLFLLFDR